MKRQGLMLAALALVLLVNALALGGVWWNRTGEASASLRLSERELQLPPDWRRQPRRENSGMSLRLNYRVLAPEYAPESEDAAARMAPNSYNREAEWLDEAKLRELGLDLPRLDAHDDRRADWRHPLASPVWWVLEFDGEAYQRSLKAAEAWAEWARHASADELRKTTYAVPDQDQIERELRAERERNSRLFVIDAGRDPAELRQRYPDRDRYALVSGQLRPVWGGWYAGKPAQWRGMVEAVDVDSLYVSTTWRSLVENLKGELYDDTRPPRFSAVVTWGARYEPWLVELKDESIADGLPPPLPD